ncbi:hypothetical protein NA56DRAFT_697157 [Hyaloscypha hepaticicola]|uniref:Uncharacterized protein n=1 Tax=Hyaloscypha hepaticicola TaxID=2082293 RepID=A0A2J6QL60_9HELO|nr:hypothetical protein NA56DRAFT_697157 [Hyaloscypha hepaticicola]
MPPQSISRTPSPGVGINTRRSALHGFPNMCEIHNNSSEQRSGQMASIVDTGSSESSVTSTEGSPQRDVNIQAPQKVSVPTSLQSTSTGRRKVADCSSKLSNENFSRSMDAQSNNATQGTVDEVVYSAAKSLRAASLDDGFTFFGDVPRTTIVVKWMRFYHYYPNADKATDKLRRDELKAHLKIPPGCGQRLGSFIINKFNCFRKWGYVYWDGKHNVEYFPRTDAWLSPTWDGHIERLVDKDSTLRNTRSPSNQRVRAKRSRSPPAERREKRQKPTEKSSATCSVEITTTIPKNSADSCSKPNTLPGERLLPSRNQSLNNVFDEQWELGNRFDLPPRTETNNSRRTQEIDITLGELTNPVDDSTIRVSVAPKMTATITKAAKEGETLASSAGTTNDCKTRTEKVGSNPIRSRDLAPDPHDLSARLEAASSQSTFGTANGDTGSCQLAATTKHNGNLGPLREKEKSCIRVLKESLKELESSRVDHKRLCEQYKILETDTRDMMKIIDKNSRRRKATATPTLLGVDQAALTDSLKALIYHHREDEFVRAKKQEMLSLEARIAEVTERKSRLKTSITAKKLDLKDLQGDIKETLRFEARTDRFGEKLAALWCEFKHFDGHSSSGTMSPVESVPESVSCDLDGADQLTEADGSSELNMLDLVELEE